MNSSARRWASTSTLLICIARSSAALADRRVTKNQSLNRHSATAVAQQVQVALPSSQAVLHRPRSLRSTQQLIWQAASRNWPIIN